MFTKTVNNKHNPSFSDVPLSKQKEWFDRECLQYKNVYLESLRIFNKFKTSNNRERLCLCKKEYKDICHRKKRVFENIKLNQIENLRKSKPKEF